VNDLLATKAAEWLHYDKAVRATPTQWDVFDIDGRKVGEIFAIPVYQEPKP
jgi:hypothetical protein